MESSIILRSVDELKFLGVIRSDREYSRKLKRNENWLRSLRRSDVQASQRVRHTTAMRLQRWLIELNEQAASPSIAERLKSLIEQINEADWQERYDARQAHGR
ncbi:MAG TPA: DUF6626 family protein [Bosea sp. (in: a-proteobacteria)]